MKKMRIIPWVFGILAFAAAAAALFLTTRYLHAPPVLVEVPDAALEQVEAMMDAVCEGDYEEAARHLYGCPDLGLDREPADPVGILIWNAFADSLSYELAGECFATDAGLSQKVVFRSLEFESITEKLGERAQTLLAQRMAWRNQRIPPRFMMKTTNTGRTSLWRFSAMPRRMPLRRMPAIRSRKLP